MNTKKSNEYWVIPPEADEEFAAHMEDVLDVYSRPYDAGWPGQELAGSRSDKKLVPQHSATVWLSSHQ